MPIFSKKEFASRKYVDLINEASSQWANWNPSIEIKAGDYGYIDRKSGDFVTEGNIYNVEALFDLTEQYPPVTEAGLDWYHVKSKKGVKYIGGADAHGGVQGVADASFLGEWQFGKTRAAVLFMHKPRITRVPKEFLHASKDRRLLKKKTLVLEVFSCPAYALYLSDKSNETISLAFKADVPTTVPGVEVGAEAISRFEMSGCIGTSHHGYNKDAKFTPLYVPWTNRLNGFRRESPRPEPVDRFASDWRNTEIPWGILDEDGNDSDEDSDESDAE